MFIAKVIPGIETSDGDGVRLTRMIGTQMCEMIDPFLMLDRFDNDDPNAYIGGFPDHPHRGFETVTVMLDGRMRHKDSTGGEGIIGPGDVQWMTAGRGVIHSEMPEQIEGRMRGFQLWVNLPKDLKMSEPGYQEISKSAIPVSERDGLITHVIAGSYDGLTGPARSHTALRLLRIEAKPGTKIEISPSQGHKAFFCIYDGQIEGVQAKDELTVAEAASLVLMEGDGSIYVTAGVNGAALLYGEGEPISEPVARYGPFVMNTQQELMQAVQDFQSGRLTQ